MDGGGREEGEPKNFYWAFRELLQNVFGLVVGRFRYGSKVYTQFFFHSCRSYLDILLLIFVMSQNLRLVSILKKAYALSKWNRILSTFYYDYIYIWLVYILNTKILRTFWIFLFRIGKHYSVTSKKSLLIIHLFIHFQLIIIKD